ncbi:DUF262 domain-containing protein [Wenyingzhuangia sp. 2_MG-2023]|uniref:DUF262 domain-containing protein n=1 Tax=Wenyingzhuangia sp. 2_MG-2023 TaxID=3062639 RepID=UPI0026E3C6E7|nr:DUF262 domain-containing protein [Wenyingzhuangia sp. 2_MG-2023]MDO6738735.1 DUF262 domain-containing protein [Wenyingzhuangia sp. 2_MG-2023]
MLRKEFKDWLIDSEKYDTTTINSRLGNCSTIEQAYGNLDGHYEKDRLSAVSKLLKYSKQDQREGVKPQLPLEIDGNIYTGLATLRQALNRYLEFKLELEADGDSVEEIVLNNDFKIINNSKLTSNMSQLQIENENTLLLLPIKNLSNKTFEIGSYQRGYKWSKKEILELLNDIDNYEQKEGLYCLQPLVLKPLKNQKEKIEISNTTYNIFTNNEVVDGQQRTTTIFLLLKYLEYKGWIDKSCLYEIEFKTRERSGVFLKEKLPLIFKSNLDSITKEELERKEYHDLKIVNQLWRDFITSNKDYNNVDVYHFFVVTSYLIRWIESYLFNEEKRNTFIKKLLDHVKVIWYSLDNSENDNQIIKVFLNNNKGKIGLTSSELIKALFILDIKNSESASISDIQINQFALEWDSVEKQLQEDNFWYFIQPDEEKYKDGTRIDYLFDLLLEKPNNSDDFFAYRYFEGKFNSQKDTKDISKSWENVIQLYYKLLNWYQDSEIFHFVGFLTNSNIKSVDKLLIENKGKTKEELKKSLRKTVRANFKKKGKTEEGDEFFIYSKDHLHYENYYLETRKVLLLYNVFYYMDNMAGHKFPFELFIKEKWSIEHIIPQTPKDIEDIDIYAQWFEDIMAYRELEGGAALINRIKAYPSMEDLKKDKELKADLDKIITESEDITHDLNNLLLLDRNTNSTLSNKLFDEKRNKILQFDKSGYSDKGKPVFIPNETLNAFNKTFSKEINIKNWTKEDGDNYVVAIQERLNEFLPTKLESTTPKA